MGGMSVWHWLIVLLVIVLLFGAKKIPELAKGLGSGIRTFKKELDGEKKDDGEGADSKAPAAAATTATNSKIESTQPTQPQQVEVIEAQVIESTPTTNANKEQKA
ncbi:twin-arginine translocase TatA/TatE family subunit [Helicobacter saguini]|uniref:Sec-independent protein translocase protein TatA n=1 Tax=Helicobacter saguini TaxID=1548018 RepID=A0A347VPY9_9HELI|nr:twin-arginine translocase TatA/TatE family subunit [Helicobacter saguini]MWV61151.1 twin-arginine translocase TatA/TatE family subunit [Helicobacter saguini]MWV68180.1 twin-arginine translocase TatA/TatE family subunit [Helicobacter saguini]MWV70356.1 twin-arginine translocase TatA/TatE family subunit [Helicobacter saguini]MWV72258.1 twin-arginine translocase TatA/TatE family subunit [Helicobacter saguini]TLD95303.1 twin-arginine translocase TatA/TatE family subunit [Helicobacter saguini]